MTRWGIAIALAVLCNRPPVGAQLLAPPLPPAVLEALPPHVREHLRSAYDNAHAQPNNPSALGRLGMLLHAYDQYVLASACYERARALDPRAKVWSYLRGVAQAELGNATEAATAFRRVLQIDVGDVPARLRLADALLAGGDPSASRGEYEILLRTYPELAIAHYGLGRALSTLGESDAALREYERAVNLAPQFGQAHYVLGLAYRDAGARDKASAHMDAYGRFGARRPAVADPALEEVRSLVGTARELIAQATAAAKMGRIDEAIALHLKAIDADPTAAQAHVNLISLYARAGQAEEAERHYQAALTLGSHVADAHYNVGVLRASRGQSVEAASAFRRALDVDPFHVSAHYNLGALLAREGKREEAVEQFRQALASDPLHEAARAGLGRVLMELGQSAEAMEQFQQLERIKAARR